MIKIAVVEDDVKATEILCNLIDEYAKNTGKEFKVQAYEGATLFLDKYTADTDIVFMDINMPGMSGMDAARELRKTDARVIIIFVTDMVQYAIQGYEVNAIDFIPKPVKYFNIERVLNRALKVVDKHRVPDLIVKHNGVVHRISVADILYIEVARHRITYHTLNGDVEDWGALDTIEKSLPAGCFSRCNVAYLVGLEHVRAVKDNDVLVGETSLKISRARKKEFLAALANYLGKGGLNV